VSVTGTPVAGSTVSSSSTVWVGAAWRRIANAPATGGAAIDVPSKVAKPAGGTDDVIGEPGASRDRKGATFENAHTASAAAPESPVAPTLTAVDTQAGELIASVNPVFPAATTVATPALRS
jgi:hypothetical protein